MQGGTDDKLHVFGFVGADLGGDVGDGVDVDEGLGPTGVVHQVAAHEAQTLNHVAVNSGELGDDSGADGVGAGLRPHGAAHAKTRAQQLDHSPPADEAVCP